MVQAQASQLLNQKDVSGIETATERLALAFARLEMALAELTEPEEFVENDAVDEEDELLDEAESEDEEEGADEIISELEAENEELKTLLADLQKQYAALQQVTLEISERLDESIAALTRIIEP